jgi:Tfp pilus assembly protein PilF
LDGKRTPVARELAVLYDQTGADSKALEEYQRALRENPKNADLLNDVGYFYLARGNLAEAEKWFRSALENNPQHQVAMGNLALTLAEQGHYQQAFELFVKINGPAAAHSNLGVILVRHGDVDQAKKAFRKALRFDEQIQPAKATLAYLESRDRETTAQTD